MTIERKLWRLAALAALVACGGTSAGDGGTDGGRDGGGAPGDSGRDGSTADLGETDGGEMELEPEDPPAHVTVTASTFHSIGIVWELEGDDADHDATLSVRYRKAGLGFSAGADLIRNDYAWYYGGNEGGSVDHFAGSLMFLTPGTRYLVELTYDDPDDTDARDGEVHTFTAETRAIPVKPTAGTTYYVTPGSGSDNAGTVDDPFEGLAEANANAAPGDIFLLGSGSYEGTTLDTSGDEGTPIVYAEDPSDPGATIVSGLGIEADHLWFDDLTFVWADPTDGATPIEDQRWQNTSAIYVTPSASRPDDILVTDCSFSGYFNGVASFYPVSRWVVMDSTFVGWLPEGIGDTGRPGNSSGKGVALGGEQTPGGPGVVIAYNSVTRYADALGMAGDSDAYGNQVWDHEDDSFSSDGARENVRVWGNRFHQVAGSSISFQPQRAGPWYFLYNQMADAGNGIWKWRVMDRNVFINNTFVGGTLQGQHFMRSLSRNNLFLRGSAPIWNSTDNYDPAVGIPDESAREAVWTADWFTDVDYDGFDRGGAGSFFVWEDNTRRYDSLAGFAAEVGIEGNAIEVDRDAIFTDFTVTPTAVLTLAAGSNDAVDAGEEVANLADFYRDAAPDLGAHERGATPHPYGPRDTSIELDRRTNDWSIH